MDKFYYQFGGIQMVVIDGIADLVRCANAGAGNHIETQAFEKKIPGITVTV